MNKIIIIGNLTRDPESRTTDGGKAVCNFTVAVNRRGTAEHPEADYFRVAAWDKTGENCKKYLVKGRKVCVVGCVRAGAYVGNDGTARGTLEVTAHEVEFLTPRGQAGDASKEGKSDEESGFIPVDNEDLPF